MKLRYANSQYELHTVYAEREAAKSAGFRWDPNRKIWWTKFEENAAKLWQVADEPLKSKLRKTAEKYEKNMELSRAAVVDIEIPAPKGLEYLPFQKAGIAYAADKLAVILADDMGLGKTIQGIGIINLDPGIKKVLVICPASLKLNWKMELEKWLVRRMTVAVANGADFPDADVVVVNYDILKKHSVAILNNRYDFVIIDEAHYIKNPKTQRTQYATEIALKAGKRILMTGTPIVNRPIELFTLLRVIDPEKYNDETFFQYAKRYAAAFYNGYGWDFSGASNLEELQGKLRMSCMIRRLKADVLKELPKKTRQIVLLDSKGYNLRDDAKYKDVVASLDGVNVDFEEMSLLRHELAVEKAPAVVDFVKDVLESEDKVIVFGHHKDVIDILVSGLEEYGVVKIVGGMTAEQKDAAVKEFQNGKARVFVGNIQAAGVGLTLTAARVVVFAELDWVPGNITQAEDRAHRIGQDDNVLVYHVVVDGSIDATLAKTIVEKQEVIDRGLDKMLKPFIVEVPVVNSVKKAEVADVEKETVQFKTGDDIPF